MEHIDLFSGIGGFALAAKWTGFETVVFCEKDEFCQKVLQKRFGGYVADPERGEQSEQSKSNNRGLLRETSKRIRPIARAGTRSENGDTSEGTQDMGRTSETIPIIPEIRDFDGTKWRGATLLTGGFPCQPFSVAGKRKGKEDDRYLWPEMFRVIKEAKPSWVLAENVAGIFKMALDTVLADLESEGYTTGTVVIPAASVNASHRRDRIWIIANDTSDTKRQGRKEFQQGGLLTNSNQDAPNSFNNGYSERYKETRRKNGEGEQGGMCESEGTNSHPPDSPSQRLEGAERKEFEGNGERPTEPSWEIPWLEVATRFCRVDDGVPNRVDRLKSLGNAIVPQVAEEIMRGIRIINNAK